MVTLLFSIIFGLAVVEGCIALVAIASLTKGKWILSIKKELLSVYPLIIFICFLFIFLDIKIYPWHEKYNIWFNKCFFFIRNFVLFILVFLSSRKFAIESNKDCKKENFYACLYLFIFVMHQSLVAFDLVMPLEYPWVSTLFGGYFFVESIYAGLSIGGIICFFKYKEFPDKIKKTLKDLATLMFGFSILWIGLFYSQFLVIWYGNIPEETKFIVKRISYLPFLSYSVLISLFLFPFIIFLSKKAKYNPYVVFIVSIFVLLGIIIERFVFLIPAIH